MVAGALTGLSLIIAIGAQNAFVLRQGIRREHVWLVVGVCALADAVLIVIGTAGVGAIVSSHPTALTVVRWLGAAYLVWFAIRSIRSALAPQALTAQEPVSRGSVLATTLALTFLNPHVYLDTVLMVGTLAASHGDARWWFALGAAAASALWFPALGLGARALAGPLGRPSTWRVIDGVVALVMLVIAWLLITG
ncbi:MULTISPECIES: LysE/ArgO family amino acid transporter [unclassified Janibacter]|uniref:LysE/ArgO family amino acid transporter n=1 Tax=unclassified Janibacter TaxID=2649294 RepID=UPI003D078726